MEIFDEEIQLRQTMVRRYSEGLQPPATPPYVKEYNISVWAQYSLLHPQRDTVIARLKEHGIPTAIYYPTPLHLQEAFLHLGYRRGDFPVCEDVADRIFSIPMHPYLAQEDQKKIVDIINSVS
jgi:dTDP-4-amino-4,6-dideoxygalactose transaminase